MNFLLRFLVFVMGVVLALSLAAVLLLLATAWMLRAGWARLTGRPVAPWTMRFDPRSGFDRFRTTGGRPRDTVAADDAVPVPRCGFGTGPAALRGAADVTDVKPRPVQDGDRA